jgi:geranylgeranyl diphosphate synthase type II
VDARLDELVPSSDRPPQRLHEAIRYSLLAPGKRVRPLLCLLTAEYLGGDGEAALDAACAIEMIHTASLVLDDLPAMDDATLRRGLPANHVSYGEDTALLAAMALLNRAYGVLGAARGLSEPIRLALVQLLTQAVGTDGIIAGQDCDLKADLLVRDHISLEKMHTQKTGALFVAAVEAGARVAETRREWLPALRIFGSKLGLAFQTGDDLADALGTEATTGKNVGQDVGKPTMLSFLGHDRAVQVASAFVQSAILALEPLGPAGEPFAQLARALIYSQSAAHSPDTSALVGHPV